MVRAAQRSVPSNDQQGGAQPVALASAQSSQPPEKCHKASLPNVLFYFLVKSNKAWGGGCCQHPVTVALSKHLVSESGREGTGEAETDRRRTKAPALNLPSHSPLQIIYHACLPGAYFSKFNLGQESEQAPGRNAPVHIPASSVNAAVK